MIIRKGNPADAEPMAQLLNRIIAIGGTTAHQTPKSAETVLNDYISGPDTISCVIAEDAGQILGWQAVGWYHGDPHIGTFVDAACQARGIGSQMFAQTRAACLATGLTEVYATIRADNIPGLAYYARLGFSDIGAEPGFALNDGTIVGRVHRRLSLR